MLRHIRDLAFTGATSLPLAIAAVCLLCMLFTLMMLRSAREQTQV